ncbi:hypothetical protein [Trueperella bernardiae]|uniref:hypothetical protein n=1 Tax=Trueperella bernardiae TaxID=59561 RepID=UPI002043971D|nr:hypothetical protein [Trueperella bernardiae]MCM3907033.1 hypothetical protein [Trueperella bernardiae]
MLRGVLALAAMFTLAVQPMPLASQENTEMDSVVHVDRFQSDSAVNEDGFVEVTNKYKVKLSGKSYTIVSDARLLDEEAVLDRFRAENQLALDRMSEIVRFSARTMDNVDDYVTALIPVMTATEYEGNAITPRDVQDANSILSMCFLLLGGENSDLLDDALGVIDGLDPSSEEFALSLDRVSTYAPALAGDNADFVQDAQVFSL